MTEFYNQEDSYEILVDETESGKDRNWKGRKLDSIALSERMTTLGYEKLSQQILDCGSVLKFIELPDGRKRLYQAWFCKNKLCAICNWRRSLKHSYQSEIIIDKALEEYPNARFLFLTLTVKNVSSLELNKTLSEMTQAFNRLKKRRKFEKNVLGFLRATEVTYNKKRDDYHPHLHVLLMVRSTYYKNKENYITHKEWTDYWQKSANLGYTPIVNVKAVKSKLDEQGNEIGLDKAVRETAKYPVKPFDGNSEKLTENQKLQLTEDLYKGLYRKRQIAYGGILKTIKKQLELDDVENGDLINVSSENDNSTEGKQIIAQWDFRRQNYFIK